MADEQRDDADRQALFERVWERLQQEKARDPTLQNFDRRPTMFSLSRHGHLLTYAFGAGKRIADGEIQWRPNPDQDRPHRFRVIRSLNNSRLFQLGHEEPMDLDGIAERIVQEYLLTTRPN